MYINRAPSIAQYIYISISLKTANRSISSNASLFLSSAPPKRQAQLPVISHFLHAVKFSDSVRDHTKNFIMAMKISEVEGNLFDAPEGAVLMRKWPCLESKYQQKSHAECFLLLRCLQLPWFLGRRYCQNICAESKTFEPKSEHFQLADRSSWYSTPQRIKSMFNTAKTWRLTLRKRSFILVHAKHAPFSHRWAAPFSFLRNLKTIPYRVVNATGLHASSRLMALERIWCRQMLFWKIQYMLCGTWHGSW